MPDPHVRPVCFALPTHARAVASRIAHPGETELRALSDRAAEALARLLPILACGEESAIHVFSGLAANRTLSRPADTEWSGTVAALTAIAADEARHERWLSAWRAQLPDLLGERTRRQARRFFASLATGDPATHFTRIATLDLAVCQILAPLARNDTPLGRINGVRTVLRRIVMDEARHVRIARMCAQQWAVDHETPAEEGQSLRRALVGLLEPFAADLAILGADPDRLFVRLQRSPGYANHAAAGP